MKTKHLDIALTIALLTFGFWLLFFRPSIASDFSTGPPMEVVVVFCKAAESACVEQKWPLTETLMPYMCAHAAMPLAVEWLEMHQEYHISKFGCARPSIRM